MLVPLPILVPSPMTAPSTRQYSSMVVSSNNIVSRMIEPLFTSTLARESRKVPLWPPLLLHNDRLHGTAVGHRLLERYHSAYPATTGRPVSTGPCWSPRNP